MHVFCAVYRVMVNVSLQWRQVTIAVPFSPFNSGLPHPGVGHVTHSERGGCWTFETVELIAFTPHLPPSPESPPHWS